MENEIYTLTTMPVEDNVYDRIKNFAEDFDIPNVPLRRNMFFEVSTRKGVHKSDEGVGTVTYYMNNLELVISESLTGDRDVLLILGDSPPLEDLFEAKLRDMDPEETYNEEPMMGVVLSYDFDKDTYDLSKLETKLKEYLNGVLSFREVVVRYETHDDIYDYIMDGMEPGEDN